MSNLIMQLELTLDGFYAGKDGEFDWFQLDQEVWKERIERFESIGTVVLGRKNYEGFRGYWPLVAQNPAASEADIRFSRWLDAIPKVVFSRTLDKAEWQNSRLVKDDLEGEIERLKAQPGKDILIMSSASIAQACMRRGLIDEYWLNLHPVALGEGQPLFKERINLELLNARQYASGQVGLHYATRKV